MTRTVAEIAKRWLGTYLNTDPDPKAEELFAPTVMGWHNYDAEKVKYKGSELTALLLGRRAKLRRMMPDFKVEDFSLHVAESAFIFVQTSCGTLPDGTQVRIPVVVVWGVEDGHIVSVNSVGDYAQREVLEKAYAAAA